jgi:hypothetical protein
MRFDSTVADRWTVGREIGRRHVGIDVGSRLVSGRRHEIPTGIRLASKSILAGLHHEYQWEQRAA